MVRALERGHSIQKLGSVRLKRMFEISRRSKQYLVLDNGNDGGSVDDDKEFSRSHDNPLDYQKNGCSLTRERGHAPRLDSLGHVASSASPRGQPSDMNLMKERFVKLLLGEDMSGGGKGVSSALALSNAFTNLAASIFGEQRKLEPMPPERKARWRKEINWLLSVTDHIVEFVPSQQKSKDGINTEIMITRQRKDLHTDIPALCELDAMLIDCLDSFGDQNEFWYPSGDADESEECSAPRNDKWWIPIVKVPPNGLSDMARKWMQSQKDSVNQVLKAAMAINAQVLSEMEIPESYIESLPKNGRASLGDSTYKSITVDHFDPEQFLSTMDLSTEHSVLDLKNRIEASIVIWNRKMNQKDGRSSWGSAVSLEKRELFEERAETILLLLKQRFPGLPQSSLDISKIQFNKDVGQAIRESYSRIIESLAYTVMSRIEDVLHADSLTQTSSPLESDDPPEMESLHLPVRKFGEEMDRFSTETPTSKTLSHFMGWDFDQAGTNLTDNPSTGNMESNLKGENNTILSKLPRVVTPKKFSYLEKLENFSLRSPRARR